MAKKNPILAAHEAKLEAKYRKKLDITMQMCFDVACITANDVFHMGPGRADCLPVPTATTTPICVNC